MMMKKTTKVTMKLPHIRSVISLLPASCICHSSEMIIVISQKLTPLMMISQMLTPLAAGPCSVEPQAVDATTEAKKNLKIIEICELHVLSFGFPAKNVLFYKKLIRVGFVGNSATGHLLVGFELAVGTNMTLPTESGKKTNTRKCKLRKQSSWLRLNEIDI